MIEKPMKSLAVGEIKYIITDAEAREDIGELQTNVTNINNRVTETDAEISNLKSQLDYITTVTNMLDPDKIIDGNYVSPNTGDLVEDSRYVVTELIKIEPDTAYVLSRKNSAGVQILDKSGSRIAFYSEDESYIPGSCVVNQSPVTSPSNAVYARVSWGKTNVDEQFEVGEEFTPYVPYGISINSEALILDKTLAVSGIPADAKATGDAIGPLANTVTGSDIIPTQIGDNLVSDLVMGTSDFEAVNATYTEVTDNHGVAHMGYLLETPGNGAYGNSEIIFKFKAVVGKPYMICASIPYVDNVGPGGRNMMFFEIDFGDPDEFASTGVLPYPDVTDKSYRYIMFGNNDGNYSVLFYCKWVDEDGYCYVRMGAARDITIGRNANTRKIIERSWDGTSYLRWIGQIISVDVRQISSFTPSVLTKNILAGTGNGITTTQNVKMQNNSLAIGSGHTYLFADNAYATQSFPDGISMGNSESGNDKPAVGNVAIGYRAQQAITTAFYNTALGYDVQSKVTTGSFNIGIGRSAQGNLSGGMFNIAIGQASQGNLENGSWNIAIGNESMKMSKDATNCVSIGRRAYNDLENGDGNTAIGSRAGYYPYATRRGNYQTFIGHESSRQSFANDADKDTEQEGNTAIGAYTKANEYATAIGYTANANGIGSIAIGTDSNGVGAIATADNQIVIGTSAHSVVIAGKTITFNQDGTVSWS